MTTTPRQVPLGFTAETVLEGQHICFIFNDDTERKQVMAKYLSSGLEAGEKVFYLVDTMTTEEFTKSIEQLGVDLRGRDKDFILTEAFPVFCPGGSFSPSNIVGVLEKTYSEAIDEGYVGCRVTGEMTWALAEKEALSGDLIEYEAGLNEMLSNNPLTCCCQYDARKFDGGVIMDMLSVHPMMIVRGQLVKNPYYVEPQTFLKEFRARKKDKSDA